MLLFVKESKKIREKIKIIWGIFSFDSSLSSLDAPQIFFCPYAERYYHNLGLLPYFLPQINFTDSSEMLNDGAWREKLLQIDNGCLQGVRLLFLF